jgi:hypothetical protein
MPSWSLSPAMRDVLQACLESPDGVVSIADLVERNLGRGTIFVVRASLSRTLRRLWHPGLIELSNGFDRPALDDWSWNRPRETARQYLEMAESRAEYRRIRKTRQGYGMEPPKNYAEYRAEYLARAARGEVRAQWVMITKQGRLTLIRK